MSDNRGGIADYQTPLPANDQYPGRAYQPHSTEIGYDVQGWLGGVPTHPPMLPQHVQPTHQFEDLINALRTPRIEMKKFSGDPLEYPRFVQAFGACDQCGVIIKKNVLMTT